MARSAPTSLQDLVAKVRAPARHLADAACRRRHRRVLNQLVDVCQPAICFSTAPTRAGKTPWPRPASKARGFEFVDADPAAASGA